MEQKCAHTVFLLLSLPLSHTHSHSLSNTQLSRLSRTIWPKPNHQNHKRVCCPSSNTCTLDVLVFVYLFIYSLVSSFMERFCIPPSRIKYNIKLRLTISLNWLSSDSDPHSTVCMWMWVSWTVICSLWSLMIVLDTPTPKLDSLLIITVCVRKFQ